jgi:histidinol-phosphate aminotransferase
MELVQTASAEDLSRYPSVYADLLRSTIAETLGVPIECVTTGCGSDDLLDSAFRAAGEPGERVAFLVPTFSMVETFARMNGMEPRPVLLSAASDPVAVFADAPALLYLCSPNNPTGEVFPRPWIEEVLRVAESRGTIVLLDEAYAEFADDDFLQDAVRSTRLMVLRTMSKAYGLAGLRVGFAVGAREVIREIEKSRGPYKISRLGELAAVVALRDTEGWVSGVIREVRRERAQLQEDLEARGWNPLPSGGNFILIPLGGRSCTETTAALREKGVAVRPFPGVPGIGDAIRVSIGPRDELDQFLVAFDEVVA